MAAGKRDRKKRKSFWADGLSIDETKFSTLMVMSVTGFTYALYSHFTTGDITDNLLDLFKFLVISVVGVNGVGVVADALQRKREPSEDTTYNEEVDETDYKEKK